MRELQPCPSGCVSTVRVAGGTYSATWRGIYITVGLKGTVNGVCCLCVTLHGTVQVGMVEMDGVGAEGSS